MKLELMKVFVKAVNKEGCEFNIFRSNLHRYAMCKIKDSVFAVGPQIMYLIVKGQEFLRFFK